MTVFQRIRSAFSALCFFAAAFVLALVPEDSYEIILMLLSLSLFISAINTLFYYFTMAIHMVGGKKLLYRGVIMLDLSIMAMTINDWPYLYILFYLVAGLMFANLVDILRALDSKKHGSRHYKLKFAFGAAGIILGIFCLINYKNTDVVPYIYAFDLFAAGLARMENAFRRTAVAYIGV